MTSIRRALQRDPLHPTGPLIRRVYAYAAYRMGDGAEAEDVTGETFARALRYRDSYDAAKGNPTSWLIGIARRCVDEALAQPRPSSDPPERAGAADLEAETADRLTIQSAVAQLNERDRELIALRYGADLSARQIARRLDLSTNAVEVALHRARTRLRSILGGSPAEGGAGEINEERVRNSVPIPVRGVEHTDRGGPHR